MKKIALLKKGDKFWFSGMIYKVYARHNGVNLWAKCQTDKSEGDIFIGDKEETVSTKGL